MSLINYNEIDFNKSINKETIKIDFNGSTVEVVPYLSIKDKYDLIMATLAKANEEGIFNPILITMHYQLNLVYMYSNLVLSAEERADEITLYDTLYRSGLLTAIVKVIPEEEVGILDDMLYQTETKISQYNAGFNGLVDKILRALEGMPAQLEKALGILKDINPDLFNQVVKNNNNTNFN